MVQQTKSSINLGIGIQPDVKNQELFNELYRVYNALRSLSYALDAYTGSIIPDEDEWPFLAFQETNRQANISVIYVEAAEDISSGAVCRLVNSAGVLKAINANASTGDEVHCFNAGGVTAGNFGRFYQPNCIHGGYSGLTIGTTYWLSATDGLITATMPVTSGHIQQKVGYALSDTELFFCPPIMFDTAP